MKLWGQIMFKTNLENEEKRTGLKIKKWLCNWGCAAISRSPTWSLGGALWCEQPLSRRDKPTRAPNQHIWVPAGRPTCHLLSLRNGAYDSSSISNEQWAESEPWVFILHRYYYKTTWWYGNVNVPLQGSRINQSKLQRSNAAAVEMFNSYMALWMNGLMLKNCLHPWRT